MKVCNKCKQKKELKEFNNNKRQPDGKQRTCRSCTKEQHLDWYHDNKGTQLEKNKTVRQNKKNRFIDHKKSCKCSKCGDKRWYILDFHHLDPKTKKFEISSNYDRSNKEFWDEIKKCIPLCRNCHTEFHHMERESKITIQEYLEGSLT